MKPDRNVNDQAKFTRRRLLKYGGLGVLAGTLGSRDLGYSGPLQAQDPFISRVSGIRNTGDLSLLESMLLSLPELQIQPRGVSEASVAARQQLDGQLGRELSQTAVAELASTAFPSVVRYPAWLAVAIGLELFEIVLQNSGLFEFELPGVSREHVLPFTALIDLALIPLCQMLRDPQIPLAPEVQALVTGRIDDLRGRLVLFGDDALIAMAEALNQMLARGTLPTLIKTVVNVLPQAAEPAFTFGYKQDLRAGQMNWAFSATAAEWEKIIDKQHRTMDKLIKSLLIGKLFDRCESF